jgi:signal peptidase I
VRRLMTLVVAVLAIGLVAGCGAVADAAGGIHQYTQGGGSMEPTIKAGQVIKARTVGSDYKPSRGDIVLFRGAGPRWPESTSPLMKRVIAVGGETIACCDDQGRVTVNGTGLDETYLGQNSPLDVPFTPNNMCSSRRFDEVKVEAGSLFVMGDNRVASYDSRCDVTIPVSSVIAVVVD